MRRQAVPLLVLPRLRDALLSAGSATLEGPLRLHSHTRLLRLPTAGGTAALCHGPLILLQAQLASFHESLKAESQQGKGRSCQTF